MMVYTRDIIKHLLRYVKGDILDFGAGSAKYKKIIAERGSRYVAFDMTAGPNIDVVGDVHHPPFKDGVFDTIIMTQVLEHISEPHMVMGEIFRMMRAGGHCIITAPFFVPYHADPYDYYRYTVTGLEFLAKESGFKIVESGSYGGIITVFSEMLHFTFFNPYVGKKHGRIKTKFFETIFSLLNVLSRFVRPGNIYANSYVIAVK